MFPVAQTKTNDIIEVLSRLPRRASSNQFILRQNKKEAEALVSVEPMEGNVALGAIACMENDIDSMHRYHKIAINCSGRSSFALLNYGVSLIKSFSWVESLSLFEEAYQKDSTDIEALGYLINGYYKLGQFTKAIKLLERWQRLSPDSPHPDNDAIVQAHNFMKLLPITEEDIKCILIKITSKLSKTDISIGSIHIDSVIDGDNKFLNYEFDAKDPETNIVELEELIEDIILDPSLEQLMNHLVITFSASTDESNYDSFEFVSEESSDVQASSIDFKKIEDLIKDVEPL